MKNECRWGTRILLPLGILSGLVACSVGAALGQVIMEPSDHAVTLIGTIREMHGYGPPGYGEDKRRDAHISYLILELHDSINIPCPPKGEESWGLECQATKRLALFFLSDPDEKREAEAKKLIGMKVSVSGTLRFAYTAGEMTPIVFDVDSVRQVASSLTP